MGENCEDAFTFLKNAHMCSQVSFIRHLISVSFTLFSVRYFLLSWYLPFPFLKEINPKPCCCLEKISPAWTDLSCQTRSVRLLSEVDIDTFTLCHACLWVIRADTLTTSISVLKLNSYWYRTERGFRQSVTLSGEGNAWGSYPIPRVSWFLMELGAVCPPAMLGREQFNSIIHTQQGEQPWGCWGVEGKGTKGNVCVCVCWVNRPLSFGKALRATWI